MCNCINGCSGCNGICLPKGPKGDSAYQVWLNEGNTGTEQDFIDSLEGPQGPAGNDGLDGVGGLTFEFFNTSSVLDTGTVTGEAVIPGFTHTLTEDGDYQVHANVSIFYTTPGGSVEVSEIRLYVGGVMVATRLLIPTTLAPVLNKEFIQATFAWRGAALNTDVIELRVYEGSSDDIILWSADLLINKENA